MRKLLALILTLSISTFSYAASDISATAPNTDNTHPVVENKEINILTDEQARDMIRVTYSAIPLRSKLKKMYTAYQVTLSNEYPGALRVQSSNITNGTTGVTASQTMYTSRANMWWGALLGVGGVIIVGLPILGVISSSNKKAERESIQFPNQIQLNELQKGETVSFKALTLIGQTPQVSLALKDPKTGLTFTKNAR